MTKRPALTQFFLAGLLLCCLSAATPLLAETKPFGIATIVGSPYDPSGDGGPALQASINFSSGSVAYRDGNIYVTNGARVQKIGADGIIKTVAGLLDPVIHQPIPGFSGDGGPALGARLRGATALEFDSEGNLYIGDSGNSCVRKIAARIMDGMPQPIDGSEMITTAVGKCTNVGKDGDNGPATLARLNAPRALSFNPISHALYIADQTNNNIRKVDALGCITTVAGTGNGDYSGDGGPAIAAALKFPLGVTVDPATDTIYIADTGNGRVRKVSNGIITTVATTGAAKVRLLNGALWVLNNGTLWKIDATGNVTAVAGVGAGPYVGPFPPIGDGGPATVALMGGGANGALDFAFYDQGGVFIIDAALRRLRYVADSRTELFGVTVAAGNIATIAGPGGVVTFSGDGGPATSARLFAPLGITVDPDNNIYVADQNNFRVRTISPARIITTFAGTGIGDSGGIPGRTTEANIQPQFLVFHFGSLFITNSFTKVLKVLAGYIDIFVNKTNAVSPPAADGTPALGARLGALPLAFDAMGNVYVGDTINLLIWKIDAVTGTVKKVVGGGAIILDNTTVSAMANQVKLFNPGTIAFDPDGNLYTNDGAKNRILKITAHGYGQPLDGTETVAVFAGNGTSGFSGDDGPATAAQLAGPTGLTFDSAGNLYFTESVNFRLRQVDRFGTIRTVVGTGVAGFSGDGGPALKAQIRGGQLAFDSSGNLYLTDTVNNVVRVLDNNPPVISGMPVSGCSLWPPDGRMVHVASVMADDSGAGLSPEALQVRVTSNEPQSAAQIAITPNRSGGYDIFLHAGRLGSGSGRVYTLTATAKDRAGNVSTTTATCTVPHDQDQ